MNRLAIRTAALALLVLFVSATTTLASGCRERRLANAACRGDSEANLKSTCDSGGS